MILVSQIQEFDDFDENFGIRVCSNSSGLGLQGETEIWDNSGLWFIYIYMMCYTHTHDINICIHKHIFTYHPFIHPPVWMVVAVVNMEKLSHSHYNLLQRQGISMTIYSCCTYSYTPPIVAMWISVSVNICAKRSGKLERIIKIQISAFVQNCSCLACVSPEFEVRFFSLTASESCSMSLGKSELSDWVSSCLWTNKLSGFDANSNLFWVQECCGDPERFI